MTDSYELLLLQGYGESEVAEIQALMTEWDLATYTSVAHSIVDHADRHGFRPDYLKYLRKAHNFNRKRAKQRVLSNGSVRWNKGSEFLIERNGKIVSYGEN
jgi:glutathione peroxidase-family protein